MEKWIQAVETLCADPSQENEFNDWYNNTHLPEALSCPGFLAARRYVIKEPHFGRGKYLAIYEIETDDIDKTMTTRVRHLEQEEKRGRSASVAIPNLLVLVWQDVLFKQIHELTKNGPFKMGNWIDTVELLPTDPSQEKKLNDVYNNIHLADALKTPGFLGARRYVAERPCQGRGKYLTMYQIETDDIDKTVAIAHEGIEYERTVGRALNQMVPNSYIVIWRDIIFQKIYEMSHK
jgi:predicted Fe-Mo cluster-binding NifX family protein